MHVQSRAEFDLFAANYDAALQQGLSLTGEDKDYFAEGRMTWMRHRLAQRKHPVESVLDFGCGTGSSTPWLFDVLQAQRAVGSDVSEQSLTVAARKWESNFNTKFVACGNEPQIAFDLAFCNGVFHHIPPVDRQLALSHVYDALKPGGLFAFWENNPWNPGTRWLMSRVPFDQDAILVWPGGARNMLREAGFEVEQTDFLFYFPRPLAWLRPIEPCLTAIPLGGQYMVLARKPLAEE